jgi:hypothetical protein
MDISPNEMTVNDMRRAILAEKRVKAGLRAEELREKLDPESAIRGLLDLGEEAKSCDIIDLPRLQFRATILTTILRKCMPDLKALEVKEKANNYSRLIIDLGDDEDEES